MENRKHIVALSGGKDSTAMALVLNEQHPEIDFEYVCTPTGDELPAVLDFWNQIEGLLGKPLTYISPGYTLVDLTKRERMLPNQWARFCTKLLKIIPFLSYIYKNLPATEYVGLRADEPGRAGIEFDAALLEHAGIIEVKYPLRELGWGLADVLHYLTQKGVKIPRRTDCARCFYQTIYEWYMLWLEHPEIYESAIDDEDRTAHTYRAPNHDTWKTSLRELREEFKGGRIPKQRQRSGGCRICSL